MKIFRHFFRIIYINAILIKNGLDEIVLQIPIFAPIRFLIYLNPFNWFRNKEISRGERIRITLEKLGPIFVKFGQTLSTRRDILPEDIADQLAKLQDQVPPFAGSVAQAIIEKRLGHPILDLFSEFDINPLASASIAQVHAAKLMNGNEVVIKVLRPNVEKTIRSDVDLMYVLAKLVQKYWRGSKHFRPVEVVAEFERTIIDELNLSREAGNASQLRRNFLNSSSLYIPEIYWEYTREDVMTMERIYGVPISDIDILQNYHVDLKKLSERGVEIFFTQVFRDGFFHADMHPGNIFVNVENPTDPQYIAVDFGIVGTLSKKDQRYLAENILAFFKRDYHRVAVLHIEWGLLSKNTRVADFEAAIRCVCEPIFEKPLKEISFGKLLLQTFQVGRRFKMEIQPQLLLLQKTLLNIEGLGRQLYPDLDLWIAGKPFLEKWVAEQLGPRALFKRFSEILPFITDKLPEMPILMYETLKAIETLPKSKHQEFYKTNKASRMMRFNLGIMCLFTGIIFSLFLLKPILNTEILLYFTGALSTIGLILLFFSLSRKDT